MRLLLVFISCYIFSVNFSFASETDSYNNQLNKTYQSFIESFEKLDADQIDQMYDRDILYISEGKSQPILQGSNEVKLIYQRFFDRVKQKNIRLKIGFRLLSRDIADEQATDIGYYIIRFIPSKKSEEPVSEFAGKFLIVSKKAKNGQWLWSMEMNNRAKLEYYFNSKSKKNLFYSKTLKVDK
ncbi:DUF4440 domain-containing protein [Parashewanella spongiae]|uniref:DUF4440 domain-containing protein n=1 Tax=Parashewanella spongiae TaxID=342950 RepID=A0A3A6U2P0_9GAMM|nr:DUF4440 domain-containing protein [Parashewanella spongiae]MCL1077539.1 DUF4440 domain-containing protein [Parashewanella spongiae]RJY18279.1 DUF4440 domain-containing protein [Parashewanella spongiae]